MARRQDAACEDQVDLAADEIGGQRGQPIIVALREAVFDRYVLSVDVAGFAQPVEEGGQKMSGSNEGRAAAEEADHRYRLLLPANCPRTHYAGRQQQQQLPASHSSTAPASQGIWRVLPAGRRVRPSLMRFFEDLTAHEQHSARRLGPQPFAVKANGSEGQSCGGVVRVRRSVFQPFLPERPTPSAALRRAISNLPGSRALLSGSCVGAS
jgi:hypothetical protein